MSEKLKIRAVPNAPKSHCAGAYGDGVKIKIAAPAMDGKANAELIKYLAKTLGICRESLLGIKLWKYPGLRELRPYCWLFPKNKIAALPAAGRFTVRI